MRWWKAVGLAGAAGVVATGVVVVRAERRRRAYTPEQVREQLHVRYAQATSAAATPETITPPIELTGFRARARQLAQRVKGAWPPGRR
ncbi:hypothetical protein [Nocardia sp. NPDC051832]|uniref:hypothetical protein n=1 Tax=Nocardia sp. NPDC051832 TaxID=3155673 RepID=UPI00343EC27D